MSEQRGKHELGYTAADSGQLGTEHDINVAAVDTQHEHFENTHVLIYSITFAVLVGLAVWAMVAFHHNEADAQAKAKATVLAARFQQAGLSTLDVDTTARVLGTDAGAACIDPADVIGRGLLGQDLVSGAPGPGQRPIIAERRIIVGERIVLEVYCPDKVPEFDAAVADLRLSDDSN